MNSLTITAPFTQMEKKKSYQDENDKGFCSAIRKTQSICWVDTIFKKNQHGDQILHFEFETCKKNVNII